MHWIEILSQADRIARKHLRKQGDVASLATVNRTALKKRNSERREARKAMGWSGL